MGTPCGWTVTTCGCGTACFDKYSPVVRDRAEALATHFLWAATGRRFGLCEVTVYPCNPAPADPLYQTFGVFADPYMRPVLEAGTWRNRCGAGCTCAAACQVPLPGPVASVVEVLVAGEAVDAGAYEVHDRAWLVRTDGDCWPTCQRPGGPVAGFAATYERGDPIPPAVQYASEQLACEYAKACTGADCALPPRMRSLTRQGVSVEVATEASMSEGGRLRTGIASVDAVIEAVNPWGLTERREVYSPDLDVPRTVTSSGVSISPFTITTTA